MYEKITKKNKKLSKFEEIADLGRRDCIQLRPETKENIFFIQNYELLV